MFCLITNKEMQDIENIRKQLCANYFCHSHQTNILWKITHKKRNLKFILNNLKFKKIPRLSKDVVITEKIDGSNTSVVIMKG